MENMNSVNIHYLSHFLDNHYRNLSIDDADDKQRKLSRQLNNIKMQKKTDENKPFLKNVRFFINGSMEKK